MPTIILIAMNGASPKSSAHAISGFASVAEPALTHHEVNTASTRLRISRAWTDRSMLTENPPNLNDGADDTFRPLHTFSGRSGRLVLDQCFREDQASCSVSATVPTGF